MCPVFCCSATARAAGAAAAVRAKEALGSPSATGEHTGIPGITGMDPGTGGLCQRPHCVCSRAQRLFPTTSWLLLRHCIRVTRTNSYMKTKPTSSHKSIFQKGIIILICQLHFLGLSNAEMFHCSVFSVLVPFLVHFSPNQVRTGVKLSCCLCPCTLITALLSWIAICRDMSHSELYVALSSCTWVPLLQRTPFKWGITTIITL